MPIKYKEIKDWNHRIFFDWKHPNYGRAEFVICPQFKYGRIKRVYLTTKQQEPHRGWVFPEINSDSYSISSWVGLEKPKVWLTFWCKEHKTPTTYFYVPPNSEFLDIQILSTFSLFFWEVQMNIKEPIDEYRLNEEPTKFEITCPKCRGHNISLFVDQRWCDEAGLECLDCHYLEEVSL
jgi:hypothetical protein